MNVDGRSVCLKRQQGSWTGGSAGKVEACHLSLEPHSRVKARTCTPALEPQRQAEPSSPSASPIGKLRVQRERHAPSQNLRSKVREDGIDASPWQPQGRARGSMAACTQTRCAPVGAHLHAVGSLKMQRDPLSAASWTRIFEDNLLCPPCLCPACNKPLLPRRA